MCLCQHYGRQNRRSGRRMSEPVRVAIIGSGPAGLSAAARAAQLGLGHVLLEKTDHLSDTIFKYQKGKRVIDRKSRRLHSISNAHLVFRLLLVKKQIQSSSS